MSRLGHTALRIAKRFAVGGSQWAVSDADTSYGIETGWVREIPSHPSVLQRLGIPTRAPYRQLVAELTAAAFVVGRSMTSEATGQQLEIVTRDTTQAIVESEVVELPQRAVLMRSPAAVGGKVGPKTAIATDVPILLVESVSADSLIPGALGLAGGSDVFVGVVLPATGALQGDDVVVDGVTYTVQRAVSVLDVLLLRLSGPRT